MKLYKYYYKVQEFKKGILKEKKGNVISNDSKKIVSEKLNSLHYNDVEIYKVKILN